MRSSPAGTVGEWPRTRQVLVAVVVVGMLLAAALVAADVHTPLRPATVFLFMTIGPGLAVTGFYRLRDATTELAVAVPLSLAVNAIVATATSFAGQWNPDDTVMLSAVVTAAALVGQLVSDRWSELRRMELALIRRVRFRSSGSAPSLLELRDLPHRTAALYRRAMGRLRTLRRWWTRRRDRRF